MSESTRGSKYPTRLVAAFGALAFAIAGYIAYVVLTREPPVQPPLAPTTATPTVDTGATAVPDKKKAR
jgi:hypothetical protein